MNPFLLFASYASLGAAIKLIDHVFDKKGDKNKAIILAAAVGTLAGYLMAKDQGSATIFSALIIGVFLAKKIDNVAFALAAVAAIVLAFGNFQPQPIPTTILAFSAWLDEKLHDKSASFKKTKKIWENRPLMKIAVLAYWPLGILEPIHAASFLGFDTAYWLVDKKTGKQESEKK